MTKEVEFDDLLDKYECRVQVEYEWDNPDWKIGYAGGWIPVGVKYLEIKNYVTGESLDPQNPPSDLNEVVLFRVLS